MGKCKTYESNISQQAYKACPITAWVLLQNESERIRTFNILPPARSLSNTRFPCARLPFRHTLLNGISAVSNIFIVLCLSTRKYFLFPKPPGTCDAPLISFPLGGSSIKEVYQKNDKQTGIPGFEPGNAGIKILCLTIWRYPIKYFGYSQFYFPNAPHCAFSLQPFSSELIA